MIASFLAQYVRLKPRTVVITTPTASVKSRMQERHVPKNFFHFINLNACSLRNKADEIHTYLFSLAHEFDVLAFSETWFTNDNDVVHIEGYKCEALYREERRGERVALYVNKIISYQIISEPSLINRDFESLFIRTSSFILGVIYRPPLGSLDEFYCFLEQLLDQLSSLNTLVVILGDFNINVLEASPIVKKFTEILSAAGFRNIIDILTRVTNHSETLRDLRLTNSHEIETNAAVLLIDISDHFSLFCFIPRHSALPRQTRTAVTRIMTRDK